MDNFDAVLTLLQKEALTDIFVLGFLDYDNKYRAKRFHTLLQDVYLEFGSRLILCTAIESYYLRVQIVTSINKNLQIDEDGEFRINSVYEQYIRQPSKKGRITSLRVFLDAQSSLSEGLVRSAAFRLADGGALFLDPWNTFGIKIGTEQQLNEWIYDNMRKGHEFPIGTVYEERNWEIPVT